MNDFFRFLLAGCVLAVGAQPSSAQPSVELGKLVCTVASTDSGLFSSTIDLDCRFTSTDGARVETYRGTIDREGLTLGDVSSQTLTWVVATATLQKDMKLDGTYVGADADVSVGQGVGADYLLGGFNKQIQLQPYAVEGDSGFGLSLAGQTLTLKETS